MHRYGFIYQKILGNNIKIQTDNISCRRGKCWFQNQLFVPQVAVLIISSLNNFSKLLLCILHMSIKKNSLPMSIDIYI